MHIDARAEFSDSQVVTATAISTNVMARDGNGLSPNATQNLGAPAISYLVITTGAAVTAAGGATVTFSLESATDAGLTASPVVHYSTGAIPKASMPAGAVVAVVPLPFADYKDFIGVRYTVATGPLLTGDFNAFLCLDPQAMKVFADGKPVHPTGT